MTNIDIHADDYGYTLNTSKDILDCMEKGLLNSISIICNTSYFDESMELLYKEIPNLPFLPLMSVHINLVDGFNLTNSYYLSKEGINTLSWTNLFFKSFGKEKKEIKDEIENEIKEQINKTQIVINNCIEIAKKNNIICNQKGLRIDSHVHTHVIPIVLDSLYDVIKKEKYNIEYVRIPKEPITPFIKKLKYLIGYKPINIIKNCILNIYSRKIDNDTYMWGLVMSGKMDYKRVNGIFPFMIEKAKIDKKNLEILFHPGIALKNEYRKELNINDFNEFNISSNRKLEKDCILKIKSICME